MKLYTNPASPFCRKVEVLLHEAGRMDLVEPTVVAGHPTDTGNMPITVNPIGKIPTLALDDGRALYDSRVITHYLDDQCGTGFYPEEQLWDVLTLEATGDGISDAAVSMIYEARSRPEDMQYPPYVEGQWDKVTRALDDLDANWVDQLDGALTMGHIAVGCALGYLDFRHPSRNWRDGRAGLAAWYTLFAKRPAMVATDPSA